MSDAIRCPRILIVEDDPDHSDLLCDTLLQHYGAGVEETMVAVGCGRDCIDQDLASFDVVLLDYHLPDVEGIRLLEGILAIADVPVIFVTGEDDSGLAARAIRQGAQDYVVKLGDYLFAIPIIIEKSISQHLIKKENQKLRDQLEFMLAELEIKNRQLQQSLAKLRTMAGTDHLTGLANRRRFAKELEREYSEAVRYGHDLACCMCDLDHYKQLNDTLGHQFGDKVLEITAAEVREMLRLSDLAARYGGDEFVLLLPNTGNTEAMIVAQRLRDRIAARMGELANHPRVVTLSMGVASLQADQPASADALVAMADRALYAAKAAGRDRIILYSEMSDPVEQS